jgi:hypothetical protein
MNKEPKIKTLYQWQPPARLLRRAFVDCDTACLNKVLDELQTLLFMDLEKIQAEIGTLLEDVCGSPSLARPPNLESLLQVCTRLPDIDYKIYALITLMRHDGIVYDKIQAQERGPLSDRFFPFMDCEFDRYLCGLQPGTGDKYTKIDEHVQAQKTLPHFIQQLRVLYGLL